MTEPDVIAAFAILECDPGSSPDEVRTSYRQLVKVWHPDRFPVGDAVHHRAQEKLKQINNAYQLLTSVKQQEASNPAQETPQTKVIRVNRFIFYGSCFDETTVGESPLKSDWARTALATEFFKVIADWMMQERRVHCQLHDTMSPQFGQHRISHCDLNQRIVVYNSSEQLTLQSLMMPLVTVYIRDKVNGFSPFKQGILEPASDYDKEGLLRVLKQAGWDDREVFQSESYLQSESRLSAVATDDLLHRLFNKMSWLEETKVLWTMKHSKPSLVECGKYIALTLKGGHCP